MRKVVLSCLCVVLSAQCGSVSASPLSRLWRDFSHIDGLAPASDGGLALMGRRAGGLYSPYVDLILRVGADAVELWRYEEDANHYMTVVEEAADGGFFVASWERDEKRSGFEYSSVARLASDGALVWKISFPLRSYGKIWALAALPDGGVMAVGEAYVRDNGSHLRGWFVRLDASGEVVWEHAYAGVGAAHFTDVALLADGGVLAAGYGYGGEPSGLEGRLMRIDAAGRIMWGRGYGGGWDELCCLAVTGDGQATVAGWSLARAVYRLDAWVARIDVEEGAVLWERILDYGGEDLLEGVAAMPDGGVALAVESALGDWNAGWEHRYRVLRLDDKGRQLWVCPVEEGWVGVFGLAAGGGLVVGGGKSVPVVEAESQKYDRAGWTRILANEDGAQAC